MKKIILYSFLFGVTLITHGQGLITSDTIYKAGIYRTFQEFKYNNPSIGLNYKTSTISSGYGFLNAGGRVTFYRIDIDRKKGKSIGNVFGFCDGKNICINESNPILGPKTEFSKIEYLGKYCYFESLYSKPVYNGVSSSTSASLDEKIIDINSGEVISLSKNKIQELIADDKELLDKFNNDSQKNKKLKEYIIKYLERKTKNNK
jgi:hypothetical protein